MNIYLLIALWCGNPGPNLTTVNINECRSLALECLKEFKTTEKQAQCITKIKI